MAVNVDRLIVESEEMIVPSLSETNNVTSHDLDQFCRLCGSSNEQLMAIFIGEGVEHGLLDKIREHLPMIEITANDMLPSNICYSCASTLISWHELYHSCKEADNQFRSIIKNLVPKPTTFVDIQKREEDNFDSDSLDLPSDLDRCTGLEANSEERPSSVDETKHNLSSRNKLTNSQQSTNKECKSNTTQTTEKLVESRISCYKCKRTFDSSVKWRAHFNEQRIVCANLKIFHMYYNQMKSQPLLPPERIDPTFQFVCGQCQQRFANKENLKKHIICYHPCIEKFRCDYCPVKFVTECDLAEHRIEHSRLRNVVCSKCGGRNKKSNLSYEQNQQQIMFELCVCRKMAKNFDTIETKKKTPKTKQIGDELNKKRSADVETNSSNDCSECGKHCRTPYLLARHVKTHNNKETCDICGKSYTKLYIKSHKLIHSSQKTFVCDTCGKEFAQCSSLRSHQLLEKNIKKFVCNVCGLQFVLNSRLHTHMKSHAESLPFKCQDCDRQYGYIWQLRQHRIRHSNERTFVCETCTRSFKTKKHLKQHFVTHWKGK